MGEVTGEEAGDQASGRRLLNATAVMASGTMVSRALGFVRAILITFALGNTSRQVDAFNLALVVPNNLYMIFAGGALNTVLVPQIVRHIKHDEDAGEAFINRIMTAFLIALATVTLLACAFTPQVMGLYAPSWRAPGLAPHWNQLTLMAYITMPQLFFFGAFFLVGQVLNARDRFGPMMWAPIVNNVVSIAVLGTYIGVWGTHGDKSAPFTDEQVWLLAGGSTLGIVLQTAALIPSLRAIGFRYRPRFDLKGQGLGATFHLAKWMLGYVLVIQLVSLLVTQLATNATAGGRGAGYSAYTNAYLVWILPHSLLTVSLATAMLPSASRLAAAHDLRGVANETTRTLRLANTLILPASAGFLVLSMPFAMLVFGNGAARDDWHAVGLTLACFAAGLVPYTIQYVCLRGFYALEDTRAPFFLQTGISAVNAVAAVVLVAAYRDPGTVAPRLAIAYSVSYLVGAFFTWRALRKRLPDMDGGAVVEQLGRLFLAVLPGAAVAAVLTWFSMRTGSRFVIAAGFAAAAVVAVAAFLLLARRLGIPEATQVTSILRRRSPDSAPVPDESQGRGDAALASDDPSGTHPLLSYPVPEQAGGVASDADEPGRVLDGRYRLDRVLGRRGATQTWLGFDDLLSRPVLVHVLAADEPRTLQILDEARKAASATDSRFLRVLDAVLVEGETHGSYIVCEYAPGQSLELALRRGPLTEVEAAWLVRELADGLVGMHAQGLYHRQLNPDTVVITATGNVKIVGFLVEAALHPEADPQQVDGEAQDVEGLGKILYAALLACWPGDARYGLLAAPVDARGHLLMPRQVRPGFSPGVSTIVGRILEPAPAAGVPRLGTALEISQALSQVLGGLDASRELDRRLRYPVSPLQFGTQSAAGRPASATASGATRASVGAAVPGHAVRHDDVPDAGDRAVDPFASTEAIDFDPDDESTAPFTPVPPPPDDAQPDVAVSARVPAPEPSRTWLKVLLGLFAIVLVLSLVGVLVNQFSRSRTPAAPAETYRIAAVADFDPSADGGDDRENPGQASAAVDGRVGTAWTTERYGRSADLNGRKPGVGLVLDLGSPREVAWVSLTLGSGATTAEIRVPSDDNAAVAPTRTRDQWRLLSEVPASSDEFTVRLDRPVTTRFVLVYLTRLPPATTGTAFQGRVAEIGVGR